MKVDVFIVCIRGIDFIFILICFVGGGQLDFFMCCLQDFIGLQVDFGINWLNVWDDLQLGNVINGICNGVIFLDFDVDVFENE